MNKSDTIGELTKALTEFNKVQGSVKKSAKNTMFKRGDGKASTYAPLEEVVKSTSENLQKFGLAVLRGGAIASSPDKICREVVLVHTSGEWISFSQECTPSVGVKGQGIQPTMFPQPVCAAATYLDRTNLGAILNLAIDDDDDGNSSTQTGSGNASSPPTQPPAAPAKKNTGYKKSERSFSAETGEQITEPQYKSLYPLADQKGWTVKALKGVMQTAFVWFELKKDIADVHLYDLGKKEYAELRKVLDTK